MNRIGVFYSNLSKNQKIALWFFMQLLVIGLLAVLINVFMGNQKHVSVERNSENELGLVPAEIREDFKGALWGVIQNNTNSEEYDIVNDVVIRENSYEEVENDSGGMVVNFIVDIDSLKQTYTVSMAWGKDDSRANVHSIVVNCPPQSLMKYPETICYGMSNNTYSLDLYLPYIVYPEGVDDEDDSLLAPNIMITGNEEDKVIDVMVSACDADKFKREALDYLGTTPINLEEYTVNYEVNNINIRCQNE